MNNGMTIAGSADVPEQSPEPLDAPLAEETSPATGGGIATPGAPPSAPLPPAQQRSNEGAIVPAAPSATGIGVLVVNLGTPDAPTPAAVRRYLKEFLTDRRVIERDSLVWKMILNGVILNVRSRRKAHDYSSIWNREKNESPFKTITRSQAEKLSGILEPLGKHVFVDWAMRYGSPSIASRLEVLVTWGCERILIMPLYPQYSAATTATVCDEVFRYLMGQRRQPALRVLPAYYEDPAYIDALASSLGAELKSLSFEPEVILASYHGMPKKAVAQGDPYQIQCVRTTELLRAKLGLDENKLMMAFQSRFGRAQWLEPYTISVVKALARRGVKTLVVMTPGFSADCLETLEEINVENARVFKRHGGQFFAAVPCLNDSEAGMQLLSRLAKQELKGWV